MAGAVAALGLTFAAGRYTAAGPDVHQAETLTQTVQQWSRTRYVYAEDRVRTVYRAFKPDGSHTEVEREETHIRAQADAATASASQATGTRDTTVTAHRPDWHLSVTVGAQLAAPALPLAGPLVLGVHGERRIAGPVWLGIWGSTGGAAGASVGIEF